MTEMPQWIENACIPTYTLLIALMVYRTDAYSAVKLDASNCDSEIIYISQQQSQTVTWTGTPIPARCRVGFEATSDPHAVCIDIQVFRYYQCSFTVRVFTEPSSNYAVKKYDCSSTDTTKERCFDDKRIYLGFTYNKTEELSNPSVKIEVKNKEGEDTGISWIAIISILFVIIPGVYFIIKYGCFCLRKCFCPMLQTLPETIAECFCCETETATHNRSNSSENVRDEPPPETTTEANGSLSISGSMLSLNVLAEEPLIPSSTGTGNDWEPPPYAAISPIPPETMIEAPPTYYDVMTHGD